MKKLKRQFQIFQNKIIEILKNIIFKRTDILTGEELAGFNNISNNTKAIFVKQKNLRQLNNIYYIWDYNDNFKKLIYKYKFNRRIELSSDIAKLIEKEINFVIKREKIDYIVSVPINKKRFNERGFNQVDEILKKLNINYVKLERIKNTKKMHSILNEQERIKNVKNSFFNKERIDFSNKNILLFDDIITTGSTLRSLKYEIQKDNKNVKIVVFCLAAAREIRKYKGEV